MDGFSFMRLFAEFDNQWSDFKTISYSLVTYHY